MTQHASLAPERWARFSLGQQILQIGAEMQRAASSFRAEDSASLHASYERVLRLVDLTVEVNANPNLRRELLCWRGVIAELGIRDVPDPAAHRDAFRVLLQLHPEAARQIPLLGL
jgi:tRNA threonylcarbamoyladenosine modification (KEOPS) complex  Pcc1 subunit